MRKALAPVISAAVLAAATLSQPAMAQDGGKLQVKVLGTAVLPDGKITAAPLLGPVPADTQTKANDNYVPTLAIEYFFTPSVSVETICCMTQHDVDAVAGPLTGAELVADAKLIPATVTAKYHFNPGGISPYVGAGPAYFLWVKDSPGAATVGLSGINGLNLSDELGFALQAGLDIPMGDNGMALSLDAKRYFIDTTATWTANGTPVIQTEHKLDPWVLSAGVGFRF